MGYSGRNSACKSWRDNGAYHLQAAQRLEVATDGVLYAKCGSHIGYGDALYEYLFAKLWYTKWHYPNGDRKSEL